MVGGCRWGGGKGCSRRGWGVHGGMGRAPVPPWGAVFWPAVPGAHGRGVSRVRGSDEGAGSLRMTPNSPPAPNGPLSRLRERAGERVLFCRASTFVPTSIPVIPANAGRGSIANSACAGPKGNNPAASAWVFLRRSEFARPSCFAPSGESLLSDATKGTKKAYPAYGPDGAGLPSRTPPPRRPAPRVRPCSPSGLSRHPCRMTS